MGQKPSGLQSKKYFPCGPLHQTVANPILDGQLNGKMGNRLKTDTLQKGYPKTNTHMESDPTPQSPGNVIKATVHTAPCPSEWLSRSKERIPTTPQRHSSGTAGLFRHCPWQRELYPGFGRLLSGGTAAERVFPVTSTPRCVRHRDAHLRSPKGTF